MSSILPPEILLQIFEYDSYIHTLFDFGLSYEEQKDLCSYSLVNRSWRLVAQSLLFRFISARVNDYLKSYEKLYVSIEGTDWGKEVVVLNIHYEYSSEEVFDTNRLVQEFPNLKELALWNCKLVDLNKLSELQYLQSLQMDCCSMIISSPSVFKSLINLSLYDNKLAFSKLLQSMPFLQALSLSRPNISFEELNENLLKPLQALYVNIKYLKDNVQLNKPLSLNKLSKLKLLYVVSDAEERAQQNFIYLPHLLKELEKLYFYYGRNPRGIQNLINRNSKINNLKQVIFIGKAKEKYTNDIINHNTNNQAMTVEEIKFEQAAIGLEKGYKIKWVDKYDHFPENDFWGAVNDMRIL